MLARFAPEGRAMSASRALRIAAPAKINLGLRVTGRRADGYHELASVFVPLDLCDELALRVEGAARCEIHFELAGEGGAAPEAAVPAGAGNLAVRAAHAYLAAAKVSARVEVALAKRIPAAAGLGGGSSDAAAVLRGLAELLPAGLTPAELAAIALGLGADVPFFLEPRPAEVRGIGEIIRPRAGVPPLDLVLAKPPVGLATADVFRAYAREREQAKARGVPAEPLRALTLPDPPSTLPPPERVGSIPLDLANDLEPIAMRLCPPLAALREALRATGALAVAMTGSGPTLYGVYRDSADAERAARALTNGEAWVRVARTVDS
jgi:4-diphosphocytidyl-2-C-methyl-D-erythritol kinase